MYMGIDIGTSAVKCAVIDGEGSVVDQASAPLSVSRPQPLWSEQNPADWWSATNLAVGGLRSTSRKAVRAIGLSGQMHGATLLDRDYQVLRPAILWNDGRSAQQCVELEEAAAGMLKITGNRAMPGFTAPKLLWVRRHEPDIFAQTATVLLPKDYVRLRMTGESASDMSDSAGTLWLDVAQRRWSEIDARGHRPWTVAHACAVRGQRHHRPSARGGRGKLGHGARAGRRRRRRQCGGRDRRRGGERQAMLFCR